MSDLVVRTTGLRKTFGRRVTAVDGLDLTVPRGGVHGLLGPNGSGKTTTLRLIVGLARPTGGTIEMLGRPVPGRIADVLDRVGALVGRPGFQPNLSGRRNLKLLATARGLERHDVDRALELTGLTAHRREQYVDYSAGQRRRLAVAAAVMHRPELLLLDEPTDGLDPVDSNDVRALVRDLSGAGTTVVFGTHDLAEVEQTCDAVSVLGSGRLLASGAVANLLGERAHSTRVVVADATAAAEHLRAAGYRVRPFVEADAEEPGALEVEGHEHPEAITRLLAGHGQYVAEITATRPSLESVFLRLTERLTERPDDDTGDDPSDDPGETGGTE